MRGFCTDCGFRIASFDGLDACPQCGSRGIPCDDANQVTISVNWHELRILCMWAERYAHAHLDGAGTVYSIAARLHAQHPTQAVLTLAGEVREIQDHFGREHVQTNIPGVE